MPMPSQPRHRSLSSSPEGSAPEVSQRRLGQLEPVMETTATTAPITVGWENPYETGAWRTEDNLRTDNTLTPTKSDNATTPGQATPPVNKNVPTQYFTMHTARKNPQTAFASHFLLFCGVNFAIPIYAVYHTGQDPHVQFWICSHLHVVILLLVLYFLAYLVHVSKANPSKVAVAACLIGSPLLLLCISDYVLLRAFQLGNVFSAHDCDTWEGKRSLEDKWQSANAFYTSCINATAVQTGLSFREVSGRFRIRDCGGYGQQLKQHPEWAYFGLLEDNLRCAGWCDRAQPLFTFTKTKDSCTSAVAHMMHNRVQWLMTQAAVYSLAVLCLAAVALVWAGPALSGLEALW